MTASFATEKSYFLIDQSKPCSSKHTLDDYHSVVTLLVMTVELNNCELSFCGSSTEQVGFVIILLDSKCFPILENVTILVNFGSPIEKCWQHLEPELYTKLTRSSADLRQAKREITDLTFSDDELEPKYKRQQVNSNEKCY